MFPLLQNAILSKEQTIDSSTILLVPTDASIPLSVVIEKFNKMNKITEEKVAMIDLLIHAGNQEKRFLECEIINGEISLASSKKVIASKELYDKSYALLSELSEGFISKIVSPTIRKEILKARKY